MLNKQKLTKIVAEDFYSFALRNLPLGVIADPNKHAEEAYKTDGRFRLQVDQSVCRIMRECTD